MHFQGSSLSCKQGKLHSYEANTAEGQIKDNAVKQGKLHSYEANTAEGQIKDNAVIKMKSSPIFAMYCIC